MKIFVDARWTRTDYHDGVSRYGASLIEELHKIHPITILIHDKAQLKMLPSVPYKLVNHPFSPLELFLPRKLNQMGADVVFSPLQYMGLVGRQYKLILTVHDLIYYRHPTPPSFLPWFAKLVWRLFHISYFPQRWLLHRADAIVTVSNTSKRYIEDYITTKRPVSVVYNAPNKLLVRAKNPTKKLVYMGSFMPYKNVEALIAAMEYLPNYELLLLSKISPHREKELVTQAPKNANITFFHGVTESEYAEILGEAHALVSVSIEEGFGIPLIEAMQAGVPVVCSDIDIFHEVAGEAALFCDPHSPQDIAAKVQQLHKKVLRKELIAKGKKQAKKFSWKTSAKVLLSTIKNL